ncbi:MAG: cytochrome c [Proteobacteria bacterium]|jgi:mono/diheme cytochrome c family protein|nr:cytochrome c [Pseudomonadota bacterium]
MNHSNNMRWALLVGTLAALGAAAPAAALKIELPVETAAFKRGPGADAANEQCRTCHSVDYITTQPRDKPLAFWKAEVEKMKKVYGAPIPDDRIDELADYLARNYGTDK